MENNRYMVPRSVMHIVVALCADHERREAELLRENLPPSVRASHEGLNAAVNWALEEVEPALRKPILKDIALKRGYRKSPCHMYMAKNTYYERRMRVVYDIAIKLSLI